MKLKIYFALSLLLSVPSSYAHYLESKLLQGVDGYMMDGPTIATIKTYQFELKKNLLGIMHRDTKQRLGKYSYQGSSHSIIQLSKIEMEEGSSPELQSVLQIMIEDFEKISVPFQKSVHKAKPVMETLIIQSSKLRKREDSLINKWANPSVTDDRELFTEHVHTIKEFEVFLIDLYNFLDDLLESCPKGRELYEELRQQLHKK